MSHYSFPMLKDQEILECLHELQIQTSMDELKKPTQFKVQSIYQQFVEKLLNQKQEDMAQPSFSGMEELEYPELHEDSVPQIGFLKACDKLLTTSGINDFTLTDLTKPEYKRLRRNLSAIINFAKFYEDRLTRYMEFTKDTDALVDEKAQLEEENERLVTLVAEASRKRQQEAPEELRLKALNQEAQAVVEGLFNEQTEMQRRKEQLKAENKALKDEISVAKLEFLNATEEVENLELQIVPDVRRLTADLKALHDAEQQQKLTVKQLEAKRAEHSKQLEAIERAERALEDVLQLESACEAESQKLKELQQQEIKIAERESFAEAECSEQLHEMKGLRQRSARLAERLERLQEQHDGKQDHAQQAFNDAQRQWTALDAERGQQDRQQEENEAAIRELQDELHKARFEHEKEAARVQQQQQQLALQVRAYHKDLMAAMRAVSTSQAQLLPVA